MKLKHSFKNFKLFNIYNPIIKRNHYKTLNLPITATLPEIKTSYYEKANLYHPDKSINNKKGNSLILN